MAASGAASASFDTRRSYGFIVINMATPPEIVGFYNKRGTCEQWIKEGNGAIQWMRLSCRSSAREHRPSSSATGAMSASRWPKSPF
jgi:hypothetical protein